MLCPEMIRHLDSPEQGLVSGAFQTLDTLALLPVMRVGMSILVAKRKSIDFSTKIT
jgi:hypothetical protein